MPTTQVGANQVYVSTRYEELSRLEQACRAGDVDKVKELFANGLLNDTDRSRALEYSLNSIELTRWLLEAGADPTTLPWNRLTPPPTHGKLQAGDAPTSVRLRPRF